ncbi:MAG: hypothetical protein ACTSX6_00425 [Candidatus Heimdallarchaeaceae archaeon]
MGEDNLCKKLDEMIKDEEKGIKEYEKLELLMRECPVEIAEIRDILRREIREIIEEEKKHAENLKYLYGRCSCKR